MCVLSAVFYTAFTHTCTYQSQSVFGNSFTNYICERMQQRKKIQIQIHRNLYTRNLHASPSGTQCICSFTFLFLFFIFIEVGAGVGNKIENGMYTSGKKWKWKWKQKIRIKKKKNNRMMAHIQTNSRCEKKKRNRLTKKCIPK